MRKFLLPYRYMLRDALYWMGVFGICRMAFWYMTPLNVLGLGSFFTNWWHGLAMDFSMLAYLLLIFSFLRNFTAVPTLQKSLTYVQVALGSLLLLVLLLLSFADAEMVSFWGSRFNRQALEYLKKPQEAWASSNLARHHLIWPFTLLGLVLGVFIGIKWVWKPELLPQEKKNKIEVAMPWFRWVLLAPLLFILLRGGTGAVAMNQSKVAYAEDRMLNLAALNPLWNGLYYLVNKNESIVLKDYQPPFSGGIGTFWPQALIDTGKSKSPLTLIKQPNVLIIMLESFTSYTSKKFGKIKNHTPRLDEWASRGLSFSQCYASGDRTDKGLAAVLSAWPGQPWQSILHEPDKAAKLPSLNALAKKNQYHTAFYYGGDATFANMAAYLKQTGVQEVIDKSAWPLSENNSKWGVHDEKLYAKLWEDIAQNKGPFFITALTLSSHEPFEVPMETQVKGDDEYSKFANSVVYADQCLGAFLDRCEKTDWWENTLVVLVADHGRDFGIDPQGHFKESVKFRIPLVFTGGALNPYWKGQTIDRVVSQLDIAQTLASAIWQQDFPYSRNLLNEHQAPYAYYLFNDGIGVVGNNAQIILENHPQRIGKKIGDEKLAETLVRIGWDLQYHLIETYVKW